MAIPRTMAFNRAMQATPAETKEVSFIPEGNNRFSYNTTQYINIPIKTTTPNAFLDASHSYLEMTITNKSENNQSLYFDGMSSSIIKTLKIMQGNSVVIEETQYYNRLLDLFVEHFGSTSFATELSILSGMADEVGTQKKLIPEEKHRYNNYIPGGGSVTVCLPLMSGFMNAGKLIPLAFIPGFLSINLTLEDPRNAFIISQPDEDTAINPNANRIDYEVSGIKYIASIVSFKDNNMIENLKRQLLNEGLYINATAWDTVNQVLASNNATQIDFNLSHRCQSLKYIINAFYRNNPHAQFSNIQSNVACTNEYYVTIGGNKYPQNGVKYNDGFNKNFIAPYLQLQHISSNGYFSVNNQVLTNLDKFSRQFVNSVIDDTPLRNEVVAVAADAGHNPPIVAVAGVTKIANTAYQGSFCQALSFENFSNTQSVESGLNTALLSVSPVFTFLRDKKQLDHVVQHAENVPGTFANYPTLLQVCFLACDVIYKIGADGNIVVMK